ncbi:hypothetical protein PINS_up023066 [Pythium insidiosum]|nr:hypothetical protein PINS_up023066 [Pythium insidiosum]
MLSSLRPLYPTSTDCEEKWLRNLPLLVLVYEAIVANILDYDYSPCAPTSSRTAAPSASG